MKPIQLPGLNIYRAVAVILMILAHAARTQTNMGLLEARHQLAHWYDWPFVGSLVIEPIISAMFLFIAGFSLVLSRRNSRESQRDWLVRLGRRMLTLFVISVIFFVADQGFQWPDILVSSGVLEIIAVAVFSSALCLLSPYPWQLLAGLTAAGIGITWVLDTHHLSITGLNAGAGGMMPLLVMTYLGTLTGLAYRQWPNNGLFVLFGISLVVGLIALVAPAPWITYPESRIVHYPGDPVQSTLHSLEALVGLYHGHPYVERIRYWNHGWIFAFRAMPILVLGLIGFIGAFQQLRGPVSRFLDWMGRHALNLYIYHLVMLAVVEVGPWHPRTGWQTLLVVAAIVASSPLVFRYLSFVPLRLGPAGVPNKGA